ncbi:MAG: hypothetical protein H0X26_10465 [Alphaproteobacteria bacterium]|nr:hypothetical protein [Alphaproteobacteria bacterium]
MHSKAEAIAEPFLKNLGIKVVEQKGDTDHLGTFSGEVERPGTLWEVLKRKCEIGLDLSGLTLGIASEGSFGPHPLIPFLPCDFEALIFMDREKDFFLYETLISEKTNYKFEDMEDEIEFFNFAKVIKFPSHGVIIRPLEWDDESIIFKGIRTFKEFRDSFKICQTSSARKTVRVETDMRAHMNPTRMMVIRELAEKLSARITSQCPKCRMPGWGKVRIIKGLECIQCGTPTEKIKEEIFGCVKCSFEQSLQKGEWVGPENCHYCNP